MSIRHIRRAEPGDYPAYARLFPQMETGDPVPGVEHYQRNVMPQTQVWEEDGYVVGLVLAELLSDTGYIRHVIVDPQARGRGIGRALMLAAARTVRAAGLRRWALNVKPNNAPAVGLYRSLGMTRAYGSATVRMDWSIGDRLPPATDVTVEVAEPPSFAKIEIALGLPAGLLRLRHPDCRMLVARRGTEIVGVAAFDPHHPGAYPFRALDVPTAAALLRAAHPFADPDHDYTQLVFEDAPALVAAFVAAGARIHFEFDHYTGPVPDPTTGPPV